MTQRALFGMDTTAVDRSELVVAVKETLQLLEDQGVLEPRHRAKVQTIVDVARDISWSRPGSIARINGFRLLDEQLSELLELEVPNADDGDSAAARITRLSEYLQARRVDPDVRDAEAT